MRRLTLKLLTSLIAVFYSLIPLSANESIEEDNTYTVHRFYPTYFSINGYEFPYKKEDLIFPIELGTKLIIEERETISLPGGSYQLEFLLKSPEMGLEQRFTSRIMNDDDQKPALIVKVEEMSRNVISEIGYNWDPTEKPHIEFMPTTKYIVNVRCKITLEDGLVYKIYYFGSYYNKRSMAEAELDHLQINAGDSIVLGKYIINPEYWSQLWEFD